MAWNAIYQREGPKRVLSAMGCVEGETRNERFKGGTVSEHAITSLRIEMALRRR
jgi:hypothetical protein